MTEKKIVGMHSLKTGSYVLVDGVACRVVNIQTSRPGKHGHAKMRVDAVGLLDSKKRIFVKPAWWLFPEDDASKEQRVIYIREQPGLITTSSAPALSLSSHLLSGRNRAIPRSYSEIGLS